MIYFTGDLYIGYENILIENTIMRFLNSTDVVVSNFENVLKSSQREKREDKNAILTFSEEALTSYCNQINAKKIFSLCNNHINDLSDEGIIETKQILIKNDIDFFGAGNEDEVSKIFYLESNGIKVAFLSVSTDDPEVMSIIASKSQLGVLDQYSDKIIELIKIGKTNAEFFIILPHWGKEYILFPSYQQRKLAHKWIEAGADAVIGHHAHVLQGKEIYRGKPIYYSLGNFIFPDFYRKNGIKHIWKPINNQSVIVKFDTSRISFTEIGLYFDKKQRLLKTSTESKKRFLERSIILDTDSISMKNYYKKWEENYIETLIKLKKTEHSLFKKYFPENRDHSRIGYFMNLLRKKIL